ncbi:hypothetical protein D7X33_18355 [Butyricicoccus sp. 1XD8-22]|nr:hypothetical protein D7X33_18355 [Butyricicoccus sp. 1XD8-22]
MFEIGSFVILTNGQTKMVGVKDNDHSVTVKTATQLHKEGQISDATIWMDGDEVFVPIEQYLQLTNK